jgi:tRNA G18 (ribose-2'-O)-methylase SpoU
MNKGESLEKFQKRCKLSGFECCDPRNIVDRYKLMSDELIKGDLNNRRFNFSILLQNLSGDFNKASIIRNCNAFCGKEVILFGDKQYDRRGTCGTHVYENFKHVRELYELDDFLSEYDHIIGVDNIEGALPIANYNWDYNSKTIFIFGEEGIGICQEIIDQCHDILYIPMYGSVRSINVSSASAIVMHEYVRGCT